ncbi:MAG TPA: hypothetical protein PK156_23230, partial [Polyangium sp.]|nr:hypothetical protein [Polyangium sp.]
MKNTNLFVMTAMVCGLGGVGCNEIFDNDYGVYPAGGTPSGQGGFGGSGSANGGSGANPQNTPCEPGTQQDCYTGPPETRDVGACTPGTWTCKPDGSGYGPCVGEKLPQEATCTDQDLDCNGQKDNYVPAPKIVSPAPDKAVPGGEVFFQWSGGVAPYRLEVAYDDKFEDLVMIGNPPTPFSVETSGTTWLEELNGGFYHWRVRSANPCGTSEFVNGSKVHVTCNPVVLRADPVSSFYQPSIAWNPKKNEYGVIMGRFDPGNAYIEFLRTDRQGKLIEGSIRTFPLMSSSEPNMNPDLIYIPSIENWGIITYSQGNDEATVATFNDEFTFYREMRIPLSSSSQTHRIAYDVGMDRVVTTTDHFGGAQETYLQHFDSTLSTSSSILDTGVSCGSYFNGQFAALTALPGFAEGTNSMFLSFDHRERSLSGLRHYLFVQRVDLNETSGELAWGPGNGSDCYAGMKLVERTEIDVAFLSAAA